MSPGNDIVAQHSTTDRPENLLPTNSDSTTMKLRLSCWAENLPKQHLLGSGLPDCFAVVTLLHKDVKPTVLGRTEVIRKTNSPDFTKTFVLDYELGHPVHLVISLYNDAGKNNNSIGSTAFEVSSILGNAGVVAKELKNGGIVAARLEQVTSTATLEFQLRGVNLKNTDGIFNKSDPFFELQRARKHIRTGQTVWDAVYRSPEVRNDLNPVWSEVFLDLETLGGSDQTTPFRLVVLDYDKNGKHDVIGHAQLSVNDLIDSSIGDVALQANVLKAKMEHTSKSIQLTNSDNEETGKILVVKAKVTGLQNQVAKAESVEQQASVEVTNQVAVTTTNETNDQVEETVDADDDEIEIEVSDYSDLQPTFVNYVNGGCQLRVITAIDATAANGNPMKESSLHHFKEERNRYEEAMHAICTILSKYDTDQKYPVFGFGAKREDKVSHCFPFGNNPEVDGVDGILKVYRDTFRSGIVMASPRDFSQVIREAGKDAKGHLVRCCCLHYQNALIFLTIFFLIGRRKVNLTPFYSCLPTATQQISTRI